MDDDALQHAVRWARRLPASDVRALADAVAAGDRGVHQLRAASASPAVRQACDELLPVAAEGGGGAAVSGALLGAVAMQERLAGQTRVDVVWTGPPSNVETSRLTSAVVTGLIGEAQQELLLIGYAVHTETSVAEALRCASDGGVDITLLLERSADNSHFSGAGAAFPHLNARRLVWPVAQRPHDGAALHAKVLVIDRRVALVGSANITGWALERNLECGLLVRDRRVAASICAHIDGLVTVGRLVRATVDRTASS